MKISVHECEEKHSRCTISVTDSGVLFIDECGYNVNYCPFCGTSAAKLQDEEL